MFSHLKIFRSPYALGDKLFFLSSNFNEEQSTLEGFLVLYCIGIYNILTALDSVRL
jgi:hypothetical protein